MHILTYNKAVRVEPLGGLPAQPPSPPRLVHLSLVGLPLLQEVDV